MTVPTSAARTLDAANIHRWTAAPGLMGDHATRPHSYADHINLGGYRNAATANGWDTSALDALTSAPGLDKLRGRGGAAFPTASKLRAVAAASSAAGVPAKVIANGAEGEPLSYKDRYLMRFRPHLVLDGLILSARAVGADIAYAYAADPISRQIMSGALHQLRAKHDIGVDVRVVASQDTYVAGEESAAVRSVNTGVARPTDKPPRPFQIGIDGSPTLVLNVETLAWLAHANACEAPGQSPGFLATVSGPGVEPRLYELPDALPLGDLVREITGERTSRYNILMGGFFGGILPGWPSLPLSFEAILRQGSSRGCGALYLMPPDTCPIRVAADVAAFYADSNARQCRSCMSSTDTVAAVLASLGRPQPGKQIDQKLARWSTQLRARGACAIPDGVALLLRSILRYYPHDFSRHLQAGCEQCATAPEANRWHYLTIGMDWGPQPVISEDLVHPMALAAGGST